MNRTIYYYFLTLCAIANSVHGMDLDYSSYQSHDSYNSLASSFEKSYNDSELPEGVQKPHDNSESMPQVRIDENVQLKNELIDATLYYMRNEDINALPNKLDSIFSSEGSQGRLINPFKVPVVYRNGERSEHSLYLGHRALTTGDFRLFKAFRNHMTSHTDWTEIKDEKNQSLFDIWAHGIKTAILHKKERNVEAFLKALPEKHRTKLSDKYEEVCEFARMELDAANKLTSPEAYLLCQAPLIRINGKLLALLAKEPSPGTVRRFVAKSPAVPLQRNVGF